MANCEKCWLLDVVGNKIEYLHPISGKLVSNTIIHFRSTIWPGFNIFYKDGEIFKVYVGTGEKYETKPYFPRLMDNIHEDQEDLVMIDEFEAVQKKQAVEKQVEE